METKEGIKIKKVNKNTVMVEAYFKKISYNQKILINTY